MTILSQLRAFWNLEVGAKGSQTMVGDFLFFKTEKYRQMFLDRLDELHGLATQGQREGIRRDLLLEESKFLGSLPQEYDEILAAQEIFDGL